MADFYSVVKDSVAKLVIQLGTEIDLFLVLGSLLLLLDVYLYIVSSAHYSLTTFDWTAQHGLNIGAIVGFFVAFSFVMTVATPLLLTFISNMMTLPWWFNLICAVGALVRAFWVGMPVGAIFVVLATVPIWQGIEWLVEDMRKDRQKRVPPYGYVLASEAREHAYEKEKIYLLDRLDKHSEDKAARGNILLAYRLSARLATGFLVTVVINFAIGYSRRATMVWQLYKWSSGLGEDLRNLFYLAAGMFVLFLLYLAAWFFKSDLFEPDWFFYPPLAEANQRKQQARLEEQARFERETQERLRQERLEKERLDGKQSFD